MAFFGAESLKRMIPFAVLALLVVYVAGQAWGGEHGLRAARVYQAQLAELDADITRLSAERAMLESKAARLRDETLDLDYVDERARALTGVADRRDVIIPAFY
jgi:cell division protein FtsB